MDLRLPAKQPLKKGGVKRLSLNKPKRQTV